MIIAGIIILGMVLGSFTNALVWRFYKQADLAEQPASKWTIKAKSRQLTRAELSMLTGRSMCSHCHHELAPKDLVPLFSWVYLRGKCRYCGVAIEDSPLLEIILPLLFVCSFIFWPLTLHGAGLLQFGFWLVFLVGFLALAVYDLRWYLLPDRIVFPLIGLALLELASKIIFFGAGWTAIWSAFWGVAIASGIFYGLYIVSGGAWIGGGDVKLGIILGILVGGPLHAILLIFLASVLGSLVAIPLVIVGKAGGNTKLPFGPFLLAAAFVTYLFGSQLIAAYSRRL